MAPLGLPWDWCFPKQRSEMHWHRDTFQCRYVATAEVRNYNGGWLTVTALYCICEMLQSHVHKWYILMHLYGYGTKWNNCQLRKIGKAFNSPLVYCIVSLLCNDHCRVPAFTAQSVHSYICILSRVPVFHAESGLSCKMLLNLQLITALLSISRKVRNKYGCSNITQHCAEGLYTLDLVWNQNPFWSHAFWSIPKTGNLCTFCSQTLPIVGL